MNDGRTFEWDEAKAAANLRKHRVSFETARAFEFDAAMIEVDASEAYGEERLVALGFIGPRVHVLVYVERNGAVRVISLRAATRQEVRTYEDYLEHGW